MSGSKWFAVHVCMYFSRSGRTQASISIWENVFLVLARGPGDARRKGERIGRGEQLLTGVTWAGKPAQLLFGGVRKVVSCAAATTRSGSSDVLALHSGVEVTYSEFRVRKSDLKAFLRGQSVKLFIDE